MIRRPDIQLHVRTLSLLTLSALAISALATSGCASVKPASDPTRELREEVAPALGLRFEGDLIQGEERNFLGVRSDELLLTRRNDSLTYFVQNQKFGSARAGGIFEGEDNELLARSRDIAERLGVPETEIENASVMQVMTTVGTIDPSGAVRTEEPQRGERFARFTRAMEGVPVFSSSLMLALDRNANIGFLELHWPEISPGVVERARTMQQRVESGWQPPEIPQAYIESVEAGILHSPAIAFVMDVQPVIRAIYSPTDRAEGKKPVLYFDLEGKALPQPRMFEAIDLPAERDREAGKSDS